MSPNRFVEVTSTGAARLFGLTKKGAVAAGFDADIVVYDPNRRHTLSASTHHMDVDYSCYEGLEVQGGSDVVLSRGKVIVDNGTWLAGTQFVKRWEQFLRWRSPHVRAPSLAPRHRHAPTGNARVAVGARTTHPPLVPITASAALATRTIENGEATGRACPASP
jgi:hypothetical protein